MAEEKTTTPPEQPEQENASGTPDSSTVENNGPPTDKAEEVKTEQAGTEQPAPEQGQDGKAASVSVYQFDKIMADKKAAEKQDAGEQDKEKAAEVPKRKGRPAQSKTAKIEQGQPAGQEEKKKQTKQAVRSPKSKAPKQAEKPKAGKTGRTKPEEEKTAPAADSPSREEQKAKLEQELRKKYGIPKTDKPVEPFVIPEVEQTVRIPHEQLHAFKNHPFSVEKNAKFMAFVSSIRAQGVTQPAIVRPDDKGGYEIISGHRRDAGSIEAGIPYTPCIIRALTDEQAIQQMVEDNVNNREVSTMELAKALKMQLEAIKHQGAREALEGQNFSTDVDKRSNEVIAERNGMSVKQVQRHIALTRLIPRLQNMVDGKEIGAGGKPLKIAFTPAVELSYIKHKNQEHIALAIDAQQSAPSLSQAQRMRKLDQENMLNGDVIDGIMLEEKKEVDKVIISGMELEKYFGKEKTPQEMKDQIIKLLDDWKGKQKEQAKPEKKAEQEK